MLNMYKLRVSSNFIIYAIVFVSAYLFFILSTINNSEDNKVETKSLLSTLATTHSKTILGKSSQIKAITKEPTSREDPAIIAAAGISESAATTPDGNTNISSNTTSTEQDKKLRLKHLSSLVKDITNNYTEILDSNTIMELWRIAADVGIPAEALDALKLASQSKDDNIAKLASQALQDLNNVRDNKPNKFQVLTQDLYITESDQAREQSNVANNEVENGIKNVNNSSERLVNKEKAEQLLYLSQYSDDEEIRQASRDTLLNQRLPQAIDMMEQSFITLDEASREVAVQSLWMFAADGIERERAISLLETAAMDSNTQTAKIARQALSDLRNPPEPVPEEALSTGHSEAGVTN